MLYDFTYLWNFKKATKNELTEAEKRLVVVRARG